MQKKRIKWKAREAFVHKKAKKPRKIFPTLDDEIGWTSRDRGPIVCTRQVKALRFDPTMDDAALRQERAALFD